MHGVPLGCKTLVDKYFIGRIFILITAGFDQLDLEVTPDKLNYKIGGRDGAVRSWFFFHITLSGGEFSF